MIERLIDNWLTRANERSFQIPFCHWLAFKGYTVVHLSRHCAMEMGKDILAIDPSGVPCAFQLKGIEGGGRMTLSRWREDLSRQLHPLVHGSIVHPSIPVGSPHRSILVINGDLDEEVLREIDDFNRQSDNLGTPDRKVETIVKGQLFNAFKELQTEFWATNLTDLKTYLELFLEDGRGQLPKEKICRILESALPLNAQDGRQPSHNEVGKMVAGCAIICPRRSRHLRTRRIISRSSRHGRSTGLTLWRCLRGGSCPCPLSSSLSTWLWTPCIPHWSDYAMS